MALNTEKYINVYYNKGDRKPYDVNGKPIAYLGQDYVGANEATIIRFNIGDDTGVVEGVADVKRPDGEKAFLIMTKVTIGTDVFYELPLTDWHTSKVGKLVIAFKAFDGAITVVDGEIQANSLRVIVSDIFNIDIGYSPNSIQETPPFDPNDVSAIIAALSTKLDKVNGINVVQSLPEPIDNSLNGRWYLVKTGSPESIGKLFVFNNNTAVEVELGTGQFNFSTTGLTTDALTAGQVRYNDTTGSLDLGLKGNHVLKVGEVLVKRVRNDDASSLKVGQLVYVFGAVGNSGLLKVKKATNIGESTSSKTFGMVATAMNTTNAKDGYVYLYGLLQGVDLTDGDIAEGSFVSGDVGSQLWLGENGKITKTLPTADNKHSVFVGYLDSFAGAGSNCSIYTKIQNGNEIGELHDVRISAVADNQILRYNSSRQVWENTSELTTAESDIDALEGRMTTEEGNVDSLEGRMTTAEGDIDDIEDGTTIVPKALADQNGNVINTTYLTQSSATATYIPLSQKGVANGVVPLGSNGKVPSIYLSGEQDDLAEFADLASFPVVGETDILYVALDTNKLYRWSGSAYVVISETLAIGTTNTTAFAGDRGLALETLTDNIVDGSQALALKDQVIRNTLTTTIPLVVNSIASTTANLTEFQVNGAKKLEVTKDGFLNQNGTRLFTQPVDTTNTFFGSASGGTATTGQFNTSFGGSSLTALTSGNANSGFGRNSLLSNTTGAGNNAFGESSGRSITTGSNNTFVGVSSGYTESGRVQLATASNSTALGYQAFTDKSDQMVFGNASVSEFVFNRNTSAIALLPQTFVSSATFAPLNATRTSISATNTFLGVQKINATTTQDMADGFGVSSLFTILDNANVENTIGVFGVRRSGADNSGRFVFETASAGSMSEKMTILPNGNVGIGTASPTILNFGTEFTVRGAGANPHAYFNLQGTQTTDAGSAIGGIYFHNLVSGTSVPIASMFGSRSGANNSGRLLFVTNNAGTETEKMTIMPNGNVGIGTSSPNQQLEVKGAGLTLIKVSSAVNTSFRGMAFGIENNATMTGSVAMEVSGGELRVASGYASYGGFQTFYTNGTEKMRILSNGNVGIGTSSPATTLSVITGSNADGIQIRRNSDTTNDFATLGFRIITTENQANLAEIRGVRTNRLASAETDLTFLTRTAGTLGERLRIRDDGLVGINETSPTAQLQVKSGATTRVPLIIDTLASHTASLAEFKLNNVAQAYFESDGGLRTPILRNLATSANSTISVSNTGAVITRNVADTNPALIVNLANASATGNIQVWQKAGSASAFVNNSGEIGTSAILNLASFQNSLITLGNTGTEIYRSSTDTNVVLKVRQNNTSTTGDIQQWILGTSTVVASVNKDGLSNFTGTLSNAQTGDYTLVLADKGKVLRVNSSSNRTVTIPLNSSVAFPIDTEIAILRYGTGTVSISPTAGVTLESKAGERKISGQYGSVALKKIGENEWVLVGSLEA